MVDWDCFTCRNNADPNPPIRERILRTDHWRAAHAFDTALPGWLILAPTTHVASLDQLSPEAAIELGTILRDLTSSLRAVTGCLKTYVLLLAEKPRFAHLNFHVVPAHQESTTTTRGRPSSGSSASGLTSRFRSMNRTASPGRSNGN